MVTVLRCSTTRSSVVAFKPPTSSEAGNLHLPENLVDKAAALLEVMQNPDLEARYLKGVLPLVAEVKASRSWAETH